MSEPMTRTTFSLKARIMSTGKGSGALAVGDAVGVSVGAVVGVGEGMGVRVGVGTAVAVAVAVGTAVGVAVDVGVGTGLGVTEGVGVAPAWQATRNNTRNQVAGKSALHNLMKRNLLEDSR